MDNRRGPTFAAGFDHDVPEQKCDCRKITLTLELGDTHASAFCQTCKHDVWIGRDIPEGPATTRGVRRRPNEEPA